MQIQNGDVTLYLESSGSPSAPTVLLLHGITASARNWEWIVPELAERFHVLSLDFRGHGRSGRAPGRYQPADYVSDAVAALEQLANGPAIVIGHSLGGVTAAALSQHRPELVRAMVLEDPPLTVMSEAVELEHEPLLNGLRLIRTTVPGVQAAGLTVAAVAGMISIMPTTKGVSYGELVFPSTITDSAAALLELDVTVLDPLLASQFDPAFDPYLPIPVPTLIIAADPTSLDCVARPNDLARARSNNPAIEVVTVHGAGHTIHDELEHRDQVAMQIRAFLAAH
jgi:esterase